MGVLSVICSLLVAAALGAAGAAKLTGRRPVVQNLDRLGAAQLTSTIGGAEVVLAAALVVGLFSETLRLVGALGAVALMAAALVFHARADDDITEMVPASIIAALALITVAGTA